MRVRVNIGKKDGVFLLPQLAVLNSDQGKFVFVVNEKVKRHPVLLLLANGKVEIGLS